MGEQLQTLAAAGVPYDTWLLDDWLDDPALASRYRTIVFWGMYDIDARRAALLDFLRTGGRTLVFLAGTGIARGVERTGFALGEKPFPARHETVAVSDVPWNMASLLHAPMFTSILGVTKGWPWQYNSPTRLFIRPAPDMKVMARFTEDSSAAVAERSEAAVRLVYVASYGGLTPEYLHHLAQTSGAYVPTDGHGLQIDMNGDFISLHALKAGHYTFRLPFKATATNLKTGVAHSAAMRLDLNLTAGETQWYGIRKED